MPPDFPKGHLPHREDSPKGSYTARTATDYFVKQTQCTATTQVRRRRQKPTTTGAAKLILRMRSSRAKAGCDSLWERSPSSFSCLLYICRSSPEVSLSTITG